MKKSVLIVLSSLLCLAFVLSLTLPPLPDSNILFTHADAALYDDVTFFYSDASADHIMPFALTSDGFQSVATDYTFYTEGFLPTALYEHINQALHKTPYADHYFHDYLLIDEVAVVAFPGDLSAVFVIDLATCQAYPLHFTSEQDLGLMYVSHMVLVEDTLIIAGGKAQALTSFVYTVHLPTLTVVRSRELVTSQHTLYEQDFAILPSGTCVFILEEALCVYDPFSDTSSTYPLDFTPTQVIPYGDLPLLFHEQIDTIRITTPDTNLNTTLELPLHTYHLVDTLIHQNNTRLTLILFDPYGTRFSHYICTYRLPDGKWLDARGLSPFKHGVLHTLQPTTK